MAQGEKTEQHVKQRIEHRLAEIELLKQEAQQQGLAFSTPTKEQLEKKIRGDTSNSPHIYAQNWTSSTTPGSPAHYQVYVSNPDPIGYYPMFVSVFFGVANFFDNIADGIAGRDERWPYLTSAPFSLASAGTSSQAFNYTTPTIAGRSTYVGNAVLWRGDLHDKGAYCDRGLFYVTLT